MNFYHRSKVLTEMKIWIYWIVINRNWKILEFKNS